MDRLKRRVFCGLAAAVLVTGLSFLAAPDRPSQRSPLRAQPALPDPAPWLA
jgi:hypothetical protein